jgi:hypothetical protein
LFRLGELIATVESAGALARRAAGAASGDLPDKADSRLDAEAIAVASRIYAREAASRVASEGLRWVVGAGGVAPGEIVGFEREIGMDAINAAQAGLVEDMDSLARKLYHEYES